MNIQQGHFETKKSIILSIGSTLILTQSGQTQGQGQGQRQASILRISKSIQNFQ